MIFEDNTTAIAVMTNNKSATRSRHFDIKYFYLADLIQRGLVSIKYVATENQVADMLTKTTTAAVFQRLRCRFDGRYGRCRLQAQEARARGRRCWSLVFAFSLVVLFVFSFFYMLCYWQHYVVYVVRRANVCMYVCVYMYVLEHVRYEC